MADRHRHDDWDSHWARYAESANLNPAQHMRHALILSALAEGGGVVERLLDVGSGQGDFLSAAARAGVAAAYAGLELSESGVRISRHKLPQAQILQVDLFSPSPESAVFEGWATAAVCSDVIEHVDDSVGFLHRLGRYLADGGKLVVTVPGGPMSAFDRHIGHRRHFSGRSVRQTLADAGFAVEKVWLAGFPFFNLYRLLVILRGRRLIADVESGNGRGAASGLARMAMSAFALLFKFNLRSSPFGWQIVAIARKA